MVNIIRQRYYSAFLLSCCLTVLTGCPGDRWQFDEEATVSTRGENICFAVPGAEDYQPVNIGINPRGTLPREEEIFFRPVLKVEKGLLCLPPSFYHFPNKGQFIITYVLHSKRHKDTPRRMVSGVEITDGCIFNIPLTDMEIVRPYSEMKKTDITSVQSRNTGTCENPYSSDSHK